MSSVSAHPAALIAYGDELLDLDGTLPARASSLLAALSVYASRNPDHGADHSALADHLARFGLSAVTTDIFVGRVGRAVRDADGGVDFSTGLRVVPTGAYERAYAAAGPIGTEEEVDVRALLRSMDAQEWRRLVHGDLTLPFDVGYLGAGAVMGPDGRPYPLVIPQIGIGDEAFHLARNASDETFDPWSLGGRDTGWSIISIVDGVTRVHDAPSAGSRGAVFLGFFAGLDVTTLRFGTREQLAAVGFGTSGVPSLGAVAAAPVRSEAPPAVIDDVAVGPIPLMVEGELRMVDPSRIHTQNRATRRAYEQLYGSTGYVPSPHRRGLPRAQTAGRGSAGVDLLAGGLRGADAALNLDAVNHQAFQLRFETHPDGRRRATLITSRMVAGDDAWILQPLGGYVQDGELELVPLTIGQDPRPSFGHGEDPDAPAFSTVGGTPERVLEDIPRGGGS